MERVVFAWGRKTHKYNTCPLQKMGFRKEGQFPSKPGCWANLKANAEMGWGLTKQTAPRRKPRSASSFFSLQSAGIIFEILGATHLISGFWFCDRWDGWEVGGRDERCNRCSLSGDLTHQKRHRPFDFSCGALWNMGYPLRCRTIKWSNLPKKKSARILGGGNKLVRKKQQSSSLPSRTHKGSTSMKECTQMMNNTDNCNKLHSPKVALSCLKEPGG